MSDDAGSTRPWWQTEGILDGASMHEPMAFLLRRGGWFADIEEVFAREYTEEKARRLAERGDTFVETCFFKGLGLQAERVEMERTKRFVRLLQKHGVKAGVYTQWGTLFKETFFREIPEARGWVQIGVDGRPIEYFDRVMQYYRWRGCPGNPDFLAFLKKVCRLAIEDFGVDVIYFDNMCLFENHDTLCYCEHCQRGLRKFLAEKYPTPEQLWRRMGIHSAEHVHCPPMYPWSNHTLEANPIIDPLAQEFIEFRCRQLADAWHEVREYIRSVNPAVGMMGNPSFPRKYNERLTSAIDFWMLRRTEAFYYMENAVRNVGVREDAVVSNIRGYRYGRALGVTFVPCGGSRVPGLAFCEGLAFNDGTGHLGADGYRPFLDFFKAHRDAFYRDVVPATNVAVLRHDNSLTLRWHEAFTVMEMAQQQLMCAGVPWMPLWGQQLFDGTLDRYGVLVVPGCGCLSAAEIERIVAFARAGGGVVLCENVGAFNEYHHRLRRWAFADLFDTPDCSGFDLTHDGKGMHPRFAHQDLGVLRAKVGDGHVIYLPQIRESREPVTTYAEIGGYDGMAHLRLPPDWRALAAAVEEVAPSPLPVRVEGPWTLMAESLRKADGSATFVHLLSYDAEGAEPGAKVVLADAAGKKATLYAPDQSTDGSPVELLAGRDGTATVQLPAFARYALLVVE